jgi:hypothetical protein
MQLKGDYQSNMLMDVTYSFVKLFNKSSRLFFEKESTKRLSDLLLNHFMRNYSKLDVFLNFSEGLLIRGELLLTFENICVFPANCEIGESDSTGSIAASNEQI